jgi:hypothetical protein
MTHGNNLRAIHAAGKAAGAGNAGAMNNLGYLRPTYQAAAWSP